MPELKGFVETAKSKRFLTRVIRLFVFFICTAGFFYQTWAFLEIYLTYPTTQDISVEYPDVIMAPAITICNNNRLSRQLLCKIYPDDCEWENTTTWEEFCETHKRQCGFTDDVWYKEDDFNFASPNFNGDYKTDRGNTILNAVGPQKDGDFIRFCSIQINPISSIKCNITMIQAANHGYPYKCFSILSLLGKKNEESLKLSLTQDIFVSLTMHPDDYIDDHDLVQAFVIIHDPRKVVNPMTEGVPLKAGKAYKLYATMEKKLSLPPPYASNCMDYLNEWKKKGGYGPLSKKDCIDLCIINAMIDGYGCVGQDVTYPNNYNICEIESDDTTTEMMRKCHSHCGDACEEKNYRFVSDVTHEYSSASQCHPKDENCLNRYLDFYVSFKRMMVEKFQHIPRFESIELFSYIGGYLGMWLGISLASLSDLAEIVYHNAYPFVKAKRKQKRTTPIEKLRHQTV